MSELRITGFFLLVTVIYTYNACSLSFGSFIAPKAGFLPVLSGCLGVALTLVQLMLCTRKGSEGYIHLRKLVFIIIGMSVYILLLKFVGYVFAVFISLLYLLKVTETEGWIFPCLFSAGTAVGFYVLFANLLGSNLP